MPRNYIVTTYSSVKNQRLSAKKMFQGYITPVHAATRYIPLFRQLGMQTIQATHVEISVVCKPVRYQLLHFLILACKKTKLLKRDS